MAEPKSYIQLCSSVYQERIHNGEAEILLGGVWLNIEQFLEALLTLGRIDEIIAAAELGKNTHGLN